MYNNKKGFLSGGIMMKSKKIICCVLFFITCATLSARKKAIIVGATSGMGRQLTKELSQEYDVGLAGRRMHLLESLQKEIKTKSFIKQIDVTQHQQARDSFAELMEEMGGLDLFVVTVSAFMEMTSSSMHDYKKLFDVDIVGTVNLTEYVKTFFEEQKSGHIVLFSSIDGLRGTALSPVYSATKSFIYTYAQGLRNYMKQNDVPVFVTTIVPGWVDNERAEFSAMDGTFWVASTKKAAKQIFTAIKNKKKVAYITKRWWWFALMLKLLPDCIYNASWWPYR